MAYNGSGTFSLVAGNPVVTGTTITSTWANNTLSDIASNGLSLCILKDGQQTPTGNIPLGGFRLTGLGAAIAANDAIRVSQLQSDNTRWVVAAGTADAITASFSPPNAALVDGMLLHFRAIAANATTTPTFTPDGLTARTITKEGGTALVIGEIKGNFYECMVKYNLANTRWELLNPAVSASYLPLVGGTVTGDLTAGARLLLSPAAAKIVGGATSLSLRNNADNADNLIITDAGNATLRGTLFGPATMLSPITASLGADVLLNNVGLYFDGPSIAQGAAGTWFASGTVTLIDSAGAASFYAKLWDGTTVIDSARGIITVAGNVTSISLFGFKATPAGNLRISVIDISSASGSILFNTTGNSKDSTITAIRIG